MIDDDMVWKVYHKLKMEIPEATYQEVLTALAYLIGDQFVQNEMDIRDRQICLGYIKAKAMDFNGKN